MNMNCSVDDYESSPMPESPEWSWMSWLRLYELELDKGSENRRTNSVITLASLCVLNSMRMVAAEVVI